MNNIVIFEEFALQKKKSTLSFQLRERKKEKKEDLSIYLFFHPWEIHTESHSISGS